MLGADYFRRALEFQERLCPQTKRRIEHLVQSNLTLVTKPLLEAFRALGITQVGSSYDHIPGIRGFGPSRDSDAYNRKFMDGISLLDEFGFTWGVIYVVHRRSLPLALDIFHFLTNLSVRTQPNFNPVAIYGEDPERLAITGEEFADFLGRIFPVWWQNRERYPSVKPFLGWVENVQDRKMSLGCEHSGSCSYEWVYIGPEGATSQCGRSGDYAVADYGNIRERSLDDILRDKRRGVFAERLDVLAKTECADCRFWGMCHGGCPVDAYMTYGGFFRKAPGCDGMRIFLERYFEPITGLHADFRPPRECSPRPGHA